MSVREYKCNLCGAIQESKDRRKLKDLQCTRCVEGVANLIVSLPAKRQDCTVKGYPESR